MDYSYFLHSNNVLFISVPFTPPPINNFADPTFDERVVAENDSHHLGTDYVI